MNTIRLRSKVPKASTERHSELIANNWVQLREPHSIWLYTLMSIPLMYLNALISIEILGLTGLYIEMTTEYAPDGISWISNESLTVSTATQNYSMEMPSSLVLILVFVGIIVAMVCIHEPLHLIFVPNFLTSNKTSIGISYYGYGFVYTEEVMSRTRHILMLLAPFLLISIVLPIFLNVFNILNPLLILLILFNAMGSSVDILGLIIILVQVPTDAYMTLNGMRTYWRKTDPNLVKT